MIFFNDLTLKRGVTVLLEHANASINPGQKVGLVGKNGCGKSSLLSLLKGEMSSEGGEVKYPAAWSLAWVNQETPALDVSALNYVIQGDREYILDRHVDEEEIPGIPERAPKARRGPGIGKEPDVMVEPDEGPPSGR